MTKASFKGGCLLSEACAFAEHLERQNLWLLTLTPAWDAE